MTFQDQIRRAWETGEIDPDGSGWSGGQVVLEPEYMNEGSQTPPAKDRDGVQLEVEGPDGDILWTPEDVERVASMWMARQMRKASKSKTASRTKTAGEVRFIKDRSGDEKQWGWGPPGPSEREMDANFKFNPTKLKPLAASLRATLMALGHAQSAYQTFTKIKSATISPDGSLGGRGYIQKIPEMRRAFMNVSEALSALSDTLYDEINAPHWNPAIEEQSPREREEVQDIMEDVEDIKKDPEEFAKEEEAEMDAEHDKKASRGKTAGKTSADWLLRNTDRPIFDRLVAGIAKVLVEGASPEQRQAARHYADLLSPRGPVREKRVEDLFYDTDATALWWLTGDEDEDFDTLEHVQGKVNTELLKQGIIGRKVKASLERQDPQYVTDLAQVRIRRVAEAHLARQGDRA
jgi:hypothetical protein